MIVYTCPKCGHDLQEVVLTSMSPQRQMYCSCCGWSHITRDEIYKIPYQTEATSALVNDSQGGIDGLFSL